MPRKKQFFPSERELKSIVRVYVTQIDGLLNQFKELLRDAPQLEQLIELRTQLLAVESWEYYAYIPSHKKRAIVGALEELNSFITDFDDLESTTPAVNLITIQTPSGLDISRMNGMRAGEDEDQRTRIGNMVVKLASCVEADAQGFNLSTSNELIFPEHWLILFAAINLGDGEYAKALFMQIPEDDVILSALLSVYKKTFIKKMIEHCNTAFESPTKCYKATNDIVYTPGAFEIAIRDIAGTLNQSTPFHFSFGLPTHHATASRAAGFCFINKIPVIINHFIRAHPELDLKIHIIGTDVNRDDGLCNILRKQSLINPVRHVDIFDPRVYPNQTAVKIEEEFSEPPQEANEVILFSEGNYEYYMFDLNRSRRTNIEHIHPAILFALESLSDAIERAIQTQSKVILFLPTGWDSHQNETAACGKLVNGAMMSDAEALTCRFNDADFAFLYRGIADLYLAYSDTLIGVYWGLEGGYNREMYEHQLELMMRTFTSRLVPQAANTPPSSPRM